MEGFPKKGEPLSRFEAPLSKEDALSQGNTWLVLRNKTRLRILYLLKTIWWTPMCFRDCEGP